MFLRLKPTARCFVKICILWNVSTPPTSFDEIQGVGLLAEETRRQLYDLVAASERAVSREEAAQQVGIPVHTAKFHLDRLAEAGLLSVEFHKRTGRTGPGSGRPSKHYRRASREVTVALPPRHYGLLSRLLAGAIVTATSTGEPVAEVARRTAYDVGHEHGASHPRGPHPRPVLLSDGEGEAPGVQTPGVQTPGVQTPGVQTPGVEDAPEARLREALTDSGYEPKTADGLIELRNCPFHAAAQEHTEFVCGVNLAYVSGMVDGMELTTCRARLDPAPGRCCVTLDIDA